MVRLYVIMLTLVFIGTICVAATLDAPILPFFLRPEFLNLSIGGKLAVSCGYILVGLLLTLVGVHREEKKRIKRNNIAQNRLFEQ